jgi:gas vesicle protein
MNTGKIVVGVLAGAAVGALAGVLFAPEKGSKTRRQIARKGEEFADTLQEKLDEAMDGVTDTYDTGRDEVRKLVSDGKARYNAVMHGVTHNVMQDGESVSR